MIIFTLNVMVYVDKSVTIIVGIKTTFGENKKKSLSISYSGIDK
jgi:ribosomal protein S24E